MCRLMESRRKIAPSQYFCFVDSLAAGVFTGLFLSAIEDPARIDSPFPVGL
jgi:hypothetical protein